MAEPHALRLGTVGWSYRDWVGPFYPDGTEPREMLRHYLTRFSAVELDSSSYGIPPAASVRSWRQRLPEGFLMCPKFPRVLTHEKFLADCDAELDEFLAGMLGLGDRLGPMLLQFPYRRKDSGVTLADFTGRLEPFLARCAALAPGARLAVEVRNRRFLAPPLTDLLRGRGVALATIDHPYMPAPDEHLGREDLVTASFAYLRLVGDRYRIEPLRSSWSREVVDQGWRLDVWARWIRATLAGADVFVFAHNHYAGFAPATVVRIAERVAAQDR